MIDWLMRAPSRQALHDATAVVLKTQELAGLDVVADGELYRFDINHPETNGMIDYFVRPLENVRSSRPERPLSRIRPTMLFPFGRMYQYGSSGRPRPS